MEKGKQLFHEELKRIMDEYVGKVYDYSKNFPKEEIYGVTSQIRRSSLSVVLNYIEGYARGRNKVIKNFLEISYGSLKESKYLVYFSFKRNYLNEKECEELLKLSDKIGAMLWGTLRKL